MLGVRKAALPTGFETAHGLGERARRVCQVFRHTRVEHKIKPIGGKGERVRITHMRLIKVR